jgi:hypothetical protein
MSRDIIIHYDEEDRKIVVSTVEHSLTIPLLAKALPLETMIDTFKAKNPDEAERALGAGIFALLDLSSYQKIGIRDYSESMAEKNMDITDEWEAEVTEELEKRSAAGDAVAQYELAMELITQGLRLKSKKKMDEADELLRNSVASGNVGAAEYLADLWPALKDRSDRSFKSE